MGSETFAAFKANSPATTSAGDFGTGVDFGARVIKMVG